MLFADLDNLKQVNDQMGHSWGDRLLCDMAEALMRYRFGGTVFRIGGDEFVVVWQGLLRKTLSTPWASRFAGIWRSGT